MAVRHDVANLVWYGLLRVEPGRQPPPEVRRQFRQAWQKAVAREAVQHLAVEQILRAFEENRIDCLPLKGSVIKDLYPRPDMRRMADVDILIKSEQAGAVKGLLQGLGYTLEHWNQSHHDVYHRPPIMNIEIHRRLVSQDSPYNAYLEKTWDRAQLKAGCRFIYQLSPEDFYIYLVIHLTKHYAAGGTGIRSFLDIRVYNNRYRDEMDRDYIQAELDKLNLRQFAQNIAGLSEVWFGRAESSELSDALAEHILSGGVYGTRKQVVASSIMGALPEGKRSFRSAKALYLLKLLFPGLQSLKSQYPFLSRRPFLLPAVWVLRALSILLFRRRLALKVLKNVREVSEQDARRLEELHRKTGLISLLRSRTASGGPRG